MYHANRTKRTAAGVLSAMIAAASLTTAPAVNAEDAASANYGEALAMSLYFYDSNACGSGITGGPLTWRGDCHTYDGTASASGLDAAARAVVDPDGDGNVDLSGGYHDAGDHVKFNLTIGFSMNCLAMSEFLNPGVWAEVGARGHYEQVLRRGADFLVKSTFLDSSGAVAAVAGTIGDGNVDHGIFTPPEVQTYERKVYWLTPSSNNSAVTLEMAAGLAGVAYVMKDSDPAYSAELIKYAKALRTFATTHVGNNCEGMSFYSTASMYEDELAMVDTWLWQLGEGSQPTIQPDGRGNYGSVSDYWKFTWDKTWQGYATMMYKATGESIWATELAFELNNASGLSETSYNNKAGWGNSRYNCALQMDALALAKGDKDSSYAKAAKFQMDYILGNNSYGYSFVIGYGTNWPTHIHHRAAAHLSEGQSLENNPAMVYTNYGAMVGGPDASGYEDHSDRYQYTEPALDYNGCFVIACAGLYKLYGGDGAALNAIVKSASEINDSYDFGNSTVVTQTTGGRTTTSETTTTSTVSSGDPSAYRRGDVDLNGVVAVGDAVLLARFVGNDPTVTTEIEPQGLTNADVDGVPGVNQDDLTKLLRILANLDS